MFKFINKIFDKPEVKELIFTKDYKNFKVYSYHEDLLTHLYKQIFNDEIYLFKSNSISPVILDIGANIGMATLFWKANYPNSKIIAIEPSRNVFKNLELNIYKNNLTNVHLINKALWHKKCQLEFTTDERISGSLITEKNLNQFYQVDTITLMEIDLDHIDFLKIDIEGAENYILDHLNKFLYKVENLFIEYHSFIHENQNLSKILEILEKNGFRYYLQGEYNYSSPLLTHRNSLGQDFQIGIWANKI